MDIISTPSPMQAWAQELYDAHGKLTPRIVLDAARSDESPAHAFVFNVDRHEASEQYYLGRAHKLIQSINVTTITRPDAQPRRVRFLVGVPGGEEDAWEYHTIDELVRQPDKLQLARREAVRRLNDAEKSIEDLDAIASETAVHLATGRALKGVKTAKAALAEAT